MITDVQHRLTLPTWEDFFDDDKGKFALRYREVSSKLAEFNDRVPPLDDDEEFYLVSLAFNDKGYRRGYGLSPLTDHVSTLREILNHEDSEKLSIPAFKLESLDDDLGVYSIVYLVVVFLGEGDNPVVHLKDFDDNTFEESCEDVYLSSPYVVDDEIDEARTALEGRDETEEEEFTLSDARGIENSNQATSTEDAVSIEDGEESVEESTEEPVEEPTEEPVEEESTEESRDEEGAGETGNKSEGFAAPVSEIKDYSEASKELSDQDIKDALNSKLEESSSTEENPVENTKKRFGFFGKR